MRLLHVSDWHLGATLGRLTRQPDHVDVLDEIVELASDYEPNLILHTGDLFDGFRPPVESMHLGFDALRRLSEFAPVVVLAGNHDSRPLFRLFNQIVEMTTTEPRIRFITGVAKPEDGGIMEFPAAGDEIIRVAAMPFLHPNELVDIFETEPEGWTGKYSDAIRLLQDMYKRAFEADHDNARHINLYAAHLHIGGAVLAKSERAVHVSNDYAVDPEALPPVTYAAFGHIHEPQKLAGPVPGRYAGSAIQLDYGEEGEIKTVVTVDAKPGQAADVNVLELRRGRPLVRLEGTLDELGKEAERYTEPMILTATVDTDEPETGLATRISELFPRAHVHLVNNRVRKREHEPVVTPPDADQRADFRDLFRDFLAEKDGVGQKQAQRLASIFERLLGSAETGEVEPPELVEQEELLSEVVD